MLIDGVDDEQLERLHWNLGGGRGILGIRHVPSGISVSRECPPKVPVRQFMEELVGELREQLKQAGVHG
jgi:hypothetical protein